MIATNDVQNFLRNWSKIGLQGDQLLRTELDGGWMKNFESNGSRLCVRLMNTWNILVSLVHSETGYLHVHVILFT